jgi:tetratricopeptide (TPR) repeat protein
MRVNRTGEHLTFYGWLRTAVLCGIVLVPGTLPDRQESKCAELKGSNSAAAGKEFSDPLLKTVERLIDSNLLVEAREKLKEATTRQGETHQSLFLEAKILFKEEKHLESIKVLERCLELEQRDPEIYKLIAFNAIRIDRMDIARPALKSAIQLAPDDYLSHFHLGALYYTGSRFPQAEPELREAVRLNPSFVPAYLFLGLTLEELGQESAAAESYRRAIEITESEKPGGELPYLYLGRLLYRQNDFPESLPYLLRAVEINPRSGESWYILAKIYTFRGRNNEAVKALRQSVEADRGYAEPHYLLSRIYIKEGRDGEAQNELRVFRELKMLEKKKDDGRRHRSDTP